MICRAAVKIYDKRQNKEMVIPCHRHCDAFLILKEFGYKRFEDYKEIEQGFLDENDTFMNRVEAYSHAVKCDQVLVPRKSFYFSKELYSEDLW